jgi:3-deoxy-manno-octulosonate cytidylyltransferase (CMP-KDO synthetase)
MTANNFLVIIPSRLKSTRLPTKMLLDVGNGIPLVIQTAKQALKSNASNVIVATDHSDIQDVCIKHHIKSILTKNTHNNGTDRIAEATHLLKLSPQDIIVNVQGDEPFVEPLLINQLVEFLVNKNLSMATLANPLTDQADIFNPNIVKVVLDKFEQALYFSRASIPYYRDGFGQPDNFFNPQPPILRHIGVYAYTVEFIRLYASLPQCSLETIEMIEQVRVLYNGYKIGVLTVNNKHIAGVDTHEDLQRVRNILK